MKNLLNIIKDKKAVDIPTLKNHKEVKKEPIINFLKAGK